MKRTTLGLCALGLSSALAFSFEVPRGTYTVDELDSARAKAAQRPELVSFVISRVSLRET